MTSGKLVVPVPRGTTPIRVVAEDSTTRSFPRTVHVTIPEENQHVVWPMTAFFEGINVDQASTGATAFGVYVIDAAVTGVILDLTIRQRRSGLGGGAPELLANGVVLNSSIRNIGGHLTATAGAAGLSLHLQIAWDASRPLSGRIDLGHLRVRVPADMPLGSSFVLRGVGTVTAASEGVVLQRPINVLPSLVNVWGGPEPTSLRIDGSDRVGENMEVPVYARGVGLVPSKSSVGWWVERISGLASVQVAAANTTEAVLKGLRAGLVRVKAVSGTRVAEKIVRITATDRPNTVGWGLQLRNLRKIWPQI